MIIQNMVYRIFQSYLKVFNNFLSFFFFFFPQQMTIQYCKWRSAFEQERNIWKECVEFQLYYSAKCSILSYKIFPWDLRICHRPIHLFQAMNTCNCHRFRGTSKPAAFAVFWVLVSGFLKVPPQNLERLGIESQPLSHKQEEVWFALKITCHLLLGNFLFQKNQLLFQASSCMFFDEGKMKTF